MKLGNKLRARLCLWQEIVFPSPCVYFFFFLSHFFFSRSIKDRILVKPQASSYSLPFLITFSMECC